MDTDGVWVFDASEEYWGEVSRPVMQRVNRAARLEGWRQALRDHLAAANAELVRYTESTSRADWFTLLPLDRESTVSLDVGAGWGANSFGLAPHVRRHYAVEKIAERVEFLTLRAQQEAATNIVPVRADLHALPFATASLDVVAVNGVLEWAGLSDPEAQAQAPPRQPKALQEAFLRELHGLLRPGGWLYVGIENRFGRAFWRGAVDHQGLRYPSLMPRAVARAYTRLRRARSIRTGRVDLDYRAWTYSLGGYLRLFERCGFTAPQTYAVVPGYNVPTCIVPLASRGPMRYLASRARSMHRVRGAARQFLHQAVAASGLERQVTSCYAFVCRRPGTRP
jgi:SAM-dependent methyltransferase